MKITEDNINVYIDNYIIPKGIEKADLKTRENVIWSLLGKWISENPLKRKRNLDLLDFIYLRFDGMQETVNKAARNYKSTMAIFELDFILENAKKIGIDKPQSKRQEKFAEMFIMTADTTIFTSYFSKVKMLIGITKQKKTPKKIQYSITAIEPIE
jgi:hypothetical protein